MVRVLIHTDTRYPVNRKIVRSAVLETLAKNKMENIDAEVSVAVVGKRKMDGLCQNYLGDNRAHEVLSFPFEDVVSESGKPFVNPPDGVLRLGDIVICWPQVLLLASRQDIMVDEEVYRLTSHSVEHLLGKHHGGDT